MSFSVLTDRIACIDVPALPLQLVLRARPEWRQEPVVVVADDRPQAPIVWANRPARAVKIRRGTTFSQAKALSAKLHAEVVSEHALDAAVDTLFERLLAFSPQVEPASDQPGLFWLDPNGLRGLFGELEHWAAQVHERLCAEDYVAMVVVGFRRGFTYAIARLHSGVRVLADEENERRLACRVPLSRLAIDPRLRDDMTLLGVRTVGDFLALSKTDLRVRYGEPAARLHTFLGSTHRTPFAPRTPIDPVRFTLQIDPPDHDLSRLLFALKSELHQVTGALRARGEAVTALEIVLELEYSNPAPPYRERVETAAPTLDVVQMVELVRLRLSGSILEAPVAQMHVTLEHTRVHPKQMSLSSGRKRDREAAARALSRLRASFGPEAVTRASLREAHLPEASFVFSPTKEVRFPSPPALLEDTPLVRRVYAKPVALPALPQREPETWLDRHGAVEMMCGPYRIAGGWWSSLRERDYFFVQTQQGAVLWLYYDRIARRWYKQGHID